MQSEDKKQSFRSNFFLWIFSALFFCFQYMLRIVPNVIASDIFSEFHVTADQFSTLGSLYLFSYSILQIPLGKMTDIYGVYRVVFYSLLLCIVGSVLFSLAEHFFILQISRFILGAGSAAALLAALKIVADYLPEKYRGLLMGLTLAMGTTSALISGNVLRIFLKYFVWYNIGFVFALLGSVLLVSFAISAKFAKSKRYESRPEADISYRALIEQLLGILKDQNILAYALLSVGFFTPLATLADLWGSMFLRQKFNLDFSFAANVSFNLYLGLGLGSILLPLLADKWFVLNKMIIFCIVVVCTLFCLLIYGPYMSHLALRILLCTIGFFCGCEMLCFSGASRLAPKDSSGHVIGVVNTFNMMGCAILQQVVGFLLDIAWNNATYKIEGDGIRIYSVANFQYALLPVFLIILICIFSAIFVLKNTKK